MEKRILGKTGMNVTVLGYGGAEIGYRGVPEETVERLINGALDAGLNVIDTAECYIDSEEKIGRAASRRRNEYFLFTKCGQIRMAITGIQKRWRNRSIAASSVCRPIARICCNCIVAPKSNFARVT